MSPELRAALRRIRRRPASFLAAAGVLATGLGLGTILLALTDALLLAPPAVSAPERLLNVFTDGESGVSAYEPMAYPDVAELRRGTERFLSWSAYAPTTVAVAVGSLGRGFGSVAELVDREYFETLGVVPSRGRTLSGSASADGCGIAVVSRSLSRRLGDRGRFRVNGLPVVAIGMAPAGFRGLFRGLAPDLWLPIDCAEQLRFVEARNVRLGRATSGLGLSDDPGVRWVWVVGRLRDDAAPEEAAREVAVLGRRLAEERPETHGGRRFLTARTAELRVAPDLDRRMRAFAGGALLLALCVLLVAAANVAALLLVRSFDRRRELAVRRALGSGGVRILAILWIEGLLIALAGAGGALVLGAAATQLLARLELPVPIPVDFGLGINVRIVGWTFGAALLSSVLFTSAPASELLRRTSGRVLRGGGATAGTAGRSGRRLLRLSVGVQLAVSLALSVVAVTAGSGLRAAARVDPGVRAEGLMALRLDAGLQGFGPSERRLLHDRIAEELRGIPSVERVSFASHLPLSAELLMTRVSATPGPADGASTIDFAAVDVDYFETAGVRLLAGRGFGVEERDDASAVVVNLELARLLWPDSRSPGEAVGRRIWMGDGSRAVRVVGVAEVGRYRGLLERDRPYLFRPLARSAGGARLLLVRMVPGRGGSALGAELTRRLREIAPDLVLLRVQSAEEVIGAVLWVPRSAGALLAALGGLSLLLSSFGLAGAAAHAVQVRRREIGIRIAVGGSPRRVALSTVLRLLPTVLGASILGLPLGRLLAGRMSGLVPVLGGVEATGGLAVLLVLGVASLAAVVPAARAARVDPASVLREQE